ncbi:hypothetical protein V6Z12_D04G015600 [Gossypium hirsutum]
MDDEQRVYTILTSKAVFYVCDCCLSKFPGLIPKACLSVSFPPPLPSTSFYSPYLITQHCLAALVGAGNSHSFSFLFCPFLKQLFSHHPECSAFSCCKSFR